MHTPLVALAQSAARQCPMFLDTTKFAMQAKNVGDKVVYIFIYVDVFCHFLPSFAFDIQLFW